MDELILHCLLTHALFRCRLPDYLLDFGHVVLGTVRTHIVRATNTGWFPTSFAANRDQLMQYGFNLEMGPVKNLPGAPDHETVDFMVSFDPRGANLGLGETEATVPISVSTYFYIMLHLAVRFHLGILNYKRATQNSN